MRGRTRVLTSLIFVATATTTGALAGGVAGVPFAILDAPAAGAVAVVVATGAALVADTLGRPAVPASSRQVPREWTRIFSPPTVGLLFGARLGVAPTTQLNTWTWWAATVAAATHGPVVSALVGATFGSVRTLVMLTVAGRSAAVDAAPAGFFGRLRREEPLATRTATVALLLGLAGIVAACSPADEAPTLSPTTSVDESAAVAVEGTVQTRSSTTTEAETVTTDEPTSTTTPDESTTTSADTSTSTTDAVATTSPEATDGVRPAGLDELVVPPTDDRTVIADPRADVGLDLAAAAARQPDPSAELPLLETRGYREGWSRAFNAPDDTIVVVSAYRFENEVEAAFYLEDGIISVGGAGAALFDVAEAPGLRGFTLADDAEHVSHGVTFTHGDLWFLVVVDGPVASTDPAMAVGIAAEQQARVIDLAPLADTDDPEAES